jgi:ribosomal protein S18 acetylase RimI-like enzyme
MAIPAADALLDCWLTLGGLIDGAWMRREDDALVGATGLAVPTLNGVWAPQPLGARRADALLDELSATGLPHSLQMSGQPAPELVERLTERGMSRAEDVPLMTLSTAPTKTACSDGLTFRVLQPDRASAHAQVAAAGFEAPEFVFSTLIGPDVIAHPAVTVLVGEIEGVAVTTGLSMTIAGRTGLFNIATPPVHRGRGYGAAVTGALIRDAAVRQANLVFLQSSAAGFSVYQRLGFVTVDTWQCWISGQ